MVISQVEAGGHADALNLGNEFNKLQMNSLSSSDFLAIISSKRGSDASRTDRQRANKLEEFVMDRKV